MKTKPQTLATLIENKNSDPLIELVFAAFHLKQLYRQGWLKNNIASEQCESVADHTYGLGILAMIIADMCFPELNTEKLLRMALIHDLAEVYSGDITPSDHISKDEKYQSEYDSLKYIFRRLPFSQTSYIHVWEEYEACKTKEARFIRQLDKLEMSFQAAKFEQLYNVDLTEFFNSTQKEISDPELLHLLENLRKLRS